LANFVPQSLKASDSLTDFASGNWLLSLHFLLQRKGSDLLQQRRLCAVNPELHSTVDLLLHGLCLEGFLFRGKVLGCVAATNLL
jgi:hypothetical protein